jgi:hypothetical protein
MNPGRCVEGWIAFEVSKATKVERIIWRPDSVQTAEWLPQAS